MVASLMNIATLALALPLSVSALNVASPPPRAAIVAAQRAGPIVAAAETEAKTPERIVMKFGGSSDENDYESKK